MPYCLYNMLQDSHVSFVFAFVLSRKVFFGFQELGVISELVLTLSHGYMGFPSPTYGFVAKGRSDPRFIELPFSPLAFHDKTMLTYICKSINSQALR